MKDFDTCSSNSNTISIYLGKILRTIPKKSTPPFSVANLYPILSSFIAWEEKDALVCFMKGIGFSVSNGGVHTISPIKRKWGKRSHLLGTSATKNSIFLCWIFELFWAQIVYREIFYRTSSSLMTSQKLRMPIKNIRN